MSCGSGNTRATRGRLSRKRPVPRPTATGGLRRCERSRKRGRPMRSKLRRLEQAARGYLKSFELLDGSRFYFDPTSAELFLHWCECVRAASAHYWPEPPQTYRKLCEARNPERALDE